MGGDKQPQTELKQGYCADNNNNSVVLCSPLTCDGRVAAGTLLGVQAAETLDAVRTVPLRGEGLASQRSFAARAEKTLFVPHLVLVGHPSFSQSLQGTQTQTVSVKCDNSRRFF